MIGAGFEYQKKIFITHTTLHHSESALQTMVSWQKITLILLVGWVVIGLLVKPLETVKLGVAILSVTYFADMFYSFYLVIKSLLYPSEINLSKKQLSQIDEGKLPLYSILCPLYKEAEVLPQFIRSIKNLDWPKESLEVILLLEENDQETIDTAFRLNLPGYIKIEIIPHSLPKTKPKACNLGLAKANGEYLVIYDAEDRPEKDQLKKAFLAFKQSSKETVCLQAKLNYYNPKHNLLTRLFTAEYSLWFDLILGGLQTAQTIIPLGGTSNHFRRSALVELRGWDPFNVTEDCDLGVRLFKRGFKTALFNSTTYEEANSNLRNWLRQRSRWIKGYLQTYLVHMREPINFYRQHGMNMLFFQLIIGMRITFILINPVLWLLTGAYFIFYAQFGALIHSLYPTAIFYIAATSAVFGNFLSVYIYMIGVAKRKQWELMKYIFLIPIYWLFASVAAMIAIYQLLIKPHYWEKTIHGFHLNSKMAVSRI